MEVLLGQGNGTFQPTTPISLGSLQPSALVAGDFNGDGRADLVVAGQVTGQFGEDDENELEVLLGDGDGTFQATTPIDMGNFALNGTLRMSLVAGDFTGDGLTDLALAGVDQFSSEGEVEVLLGQGDGTFQPMTPIGLGWLQPSALVAGDFTGDGLTDLALAGVDQLSSQGEVEVLPGQGDGTFHLMTPISLGSLQPSALVAGDFNDDGRAGLAVAGSDGPLGSGLPQTEVEMLPGHGDGTFETTMPINLGYLPIALESFPLQVALEAGDFAGDGRVEFAVVESANEQTVDQVAVVEVLAGQGDGTFQASAPIGLGDDLSVSAQVTGDFTGDGRDDLALVGVDLSGGQGELDVRLGQGDGTFGVSTPIVLGNLQPFSLVAGDFTGDGRDDIAVAGQDDSTGRNRG